MHHKKKQRYIHCFTNATESDKWWRININNRYLNSTMHHKKKQRYIHCFTNATKSDKWWRININNRYLNSTMHHSSATLSDRIIAVLTARLLSTSCSLNHTLQSIDTSSFQCISVSQSRKGWSYRHLDIIRVVSTWQAKLFRKIIGNRSTRARIDPFFITRQDGFCFCMSGCAVFI